MAKRKLSKQQQQRIADKPGDLDQLAAGLVVGHYGGEVEILPLDAIDSELPNDNDTTHCLRCHFRARLSTLVVGDRIYWRRQEDEDTATDGTSTRRAAEGVVEHIAERRSLLQRPRPYQDPKPVAANIDAIIIVVAIEPPPFTTLIDRYLIAAENAGLPVALLINKTDLEIAADDKVRSELQLIESLYPALGYPVYRTSCVKDGADGIGAALREQLAAGTSILVGQSGVGKSSLINALASQQLAATGDISAANARGKHTTTTSRLYALDEGGLIIDSPGIREFGLWHLSVEDIVDGLPEFRALASQCRFRDCQHGESAGCAITAAIEDGRILPSRASSYRQILASLEECGGS